MKKEGDNLHLLVIVLNKTSLLTEVLELLAAKGAKGATIIDSVGMGRTLAKSGYSGPLVASFTRTLKGSPPMNKTIFSVLDSNEVLDAAVAAVQAFLDLKEPGSGIMFTMPVQNVYGLVE